MVQLRFTVLAPGGNRLEGLFVDCRPRAGPPRQLELGLVNKLEVVVIVSALTSSRIYLFQTIEDTSIEYIA